MVEITFARSKDGKAKKVYKLFTILTIARTGFDAKDILGSFVDGGSDQKVSVIALVEERV